MTESTATAQPPLLSNRVRSAAFLGFSVRQFDRLLAKVAIGPHPIRLGGTAYDRRDELAEWIDSPGPDGEPLGRTAWLARGAAR